MFSQLPRDEVFPLPNYHPPVGYYSVKETSSSRKVDFGEKATYKPKEVEEPPQEIVYKRTTLPNIATNEQLHGYARPRDRVLFNKKYNFVRSLKIDEDQPPPKAKPDFYTYNPDFKLTIPRTKGPLIVPPRQHRDQSTEKYDSIQDVLLGQKIGSKRGSVVTTREHAKDIDFDFKEEEDSSNIYLPDQSTLMQSVLIEQRQHVKNRMMQQHRYKQNSKNHYAYFMNDNLEQLLLRDKRSKKPEPGPGFYAIDTSSFKTCSVPSRFQCFNTQTKRFQEAAAIEDLGPGCYDQTDFDRIRVTSTFATMQGRSEIFDLKSSIPSVGSYDVSIARFAAKRPEKVLYPSAFGSGLKRF